MINAEKLKESGIDYDAGLNRFMDDENFYEAVLAAFVSVDLRKSAKLALESRNKKMLIEVIHEAKGSSGNCGLTTLYTNASEFVSTLRADKLSDDELVKRYNDFEKEYSKTYEGIKAALQ